MSADFWQGAERELSAGQELRIKGQAAALAALMRVWGSTWRLDEDHAALARARAASPAGALVYGFWHNRMLMLAYTHRGRDIQVLRSSSKDGRLIAEVLLRFGYGAIPGSSSRGGAAGLRRLVAATRRGLDCALTVDGPRGPRGRLKSGAVQLAALSGCPFVPVAISARRCSVFSSWDRTLLPAPFSRLVMRYGEPQSLSREAFAADPEKLRRQMEALLRDFTDDLDQSLGRERIPPQETEGRE